jgi:hypothetical protein
MKGEPDHALVRNYYLRDECLAMQLFMQDLARGAFTYAPLTVGQLSRAVEVDDASRTLAWASLTDQSSRIVKPCGSHPEEQKNQQHRCDAGARSPD